MNTLKIAIPKGRIFKEAIPLLAQAGITLLDDPDTSRKLIIDTTLDEVKIVIIRATDVPVYVEYGAADMGIVGKDILLEQEADDIYEPLDLRIARCRLMVAGHPQATQSKRRLTIATKYVNITQRYYIKQGVQVDIIKLYGSMELAPLVGLADRIVDLVETGNTLRANGLEPLEHIADISSRLIVNKASMKIHHTFIKNFIQRMQVAVKNVAS